MTASGFTNKAEHTFRLNLLYITHTHVIGIVHNKHKIYSKTHPPNTLTILSKKTFQTT